MRKTSLGIAAAALVAIFVVAPAQAQATRTWVSGVGDDVNPCSRTAPCKTFAGAISKTAAGGEISVLDPGGYGAVTITKSMTINGEGTLASILASGTNGVVINAAATDKVTLRNISINGAPGTGVNGVRYLQAATVVLDRVVIQGFKSSATSRGVDVSLATAGNLLIKDSIIHDCSNGVRLATTSGFLLATVTNTSIYNNTNIGFESAAGSSFATINHSVIANNTDGVRASGSATQINLIDNAIVYNSGTAVNASVSGSRIRIHGNTITNSTTGIAIAAGAFVETSGSNRIDGNTGSTAPNDTFTQQ